MQKRIQKPAAALCVLAAGMCTSACASSAGEPASPGTDVHVGTLVITAVLFAVGTATLFHKKVKKKTRDIVLTLIGLALLLLLFIDRFLF